ncbi:hypothetical protein [Nostoc sp. FACHB-190]|uniref:hypothetical protein n=1 Tax=Nostoc sp. FACHB-190 TaxID=2692838 RepID=UPI001687B57B|nr:hypothetical protein [Nostoc sp. FACHB-190]MBD2303021.1 hypothetical protein [Nostoc sp. FACHB-190]
MTPKQYSFLWQFIAKFFKYFLLALLAFAIICILFISFGALHIVVMLLPFAGDWFSKLAVILLCLITIMVILESWR